MSNIETKPLVPASRIPIQSKPIIEIPANIRHCLEELGTKRAMNSRGTIEENIRGIKGEWAVAKYLGIENNIDTEIYDYGDGGVDLRYQGQSIDVKTVGRRANNPNLWVDKNIKLNASKYVLAQELNPSLYQIHGYAFKSEVDKARVRDISEMWHANLVREIGQDRLHSLPSFRPVE